MPEPAGGNARQAFVVLSPRSLPYAAIGLRTLAANAQDNLRVVLITDSADDKRVLSDAVAGLEGAGPATVRWEVYGQAEADERAEDLFRGHDVVRSFRNGHPCWRKLTDPPLFADGNDDLVILDPDVIFPNRFRFEPTPPQGILLMWQPPDCLYPPEVVYRAFDQSIRLSNHVDIGVCHVRANRMDWEWFGWTVERLGGAELPRIPHIEAIMWSAMAMKDGGGFLSPGHWYCWRHSHWKRVLLKGGVSGGKLLERVPLGGLKCFHLGGPAKDWLTEGLLAGYEPAPTPDVTPVLPFEELTYRRFRRERAAKDLYHRAFGG